MMETDDKPSMKEEQKKEKDAKGKMIIEIHKYQLLFDILKNPKLVWKLLLTMFCIVVIFFGGLLIVVLTIKSFYPYNNIRTNVYGAAVMEDEDKEVIYWLFNTAELWANSGIEVEPGDELTIRASGASHTAIHHLVEDADNNRMLRDQWVGTEGATKTGRRDSLRAQYRIQPNDLEGKLLMQVIGEEHMKNSEDWYKADNDSFLMGKGDLYIIGKERQNMRIRTKGMLHFAVNDIVLTDSVINKMYLEELKLMEKDTTDEVKKILNKIEDAYLQESKNVDSLLSRILTFKADVNSLKSKKISEGFEFGRSPEDWDSLYPINNELLYYKKYKFRNAWYVDNLGSFLIIIERKKHK